MTDTRDDKDQPPARYAVGYGRPPIHSRFKKGQSGNPRGRPKGSKTKRKDFAPGDLHKIILAEAYRDVPLREGERTLTLPVAQAVMRSIAVNAAKGQARAQALFAQVVSTAEDAERRRDFEYLEAAFRYKTEWTRILEDRGRRGVSGPEPLPHPDDIIIDHRRGEVKTIGPMTKEEQADQTQWREQREGWIGERAFLFQELEHLPR